ncbi:hypothetical protein ACLOJK_020265 [Asimina triloba]
MGLGVTDLGGGCRVFNGGGGGRGLLLSGGRSAAWIVARSGGGGERRWLVMALAGSMLGEEGAVGRWPSDLDPTDEGEGRVMADLDREDDDAGGGDGPWPSAGAWGCRWWVRLARGLKKKMGCCHSSDGEMVVGRSWGLSDQRDLVVAVVSWGPDHRIGGWPEVRRTAMAAIPNEDDGAPNPVLRWCTQIRVPQRKNLHTQTSGGMRSSSLEIYILESDFQLLIQKF